jgi:hypothetical protein
MSLGVSMPLDPSGPVDRMAQRAHEGRAVDLDESAEMIRQGMPGLVIHGLYGQRMMAYGFMGGLEVVGEFPKNQTPMRFQPLAPQSTLEDMNRTVMAGVSTQLFLGSRLVAGPNPGEQWPEMVLCRVLGTLMPPDPAPFTVSFVSGNEWLVRGGSQTFVNTWVTPDDPSSYDSITTLHLPDVVVTGRRGWIVVTATGSQAKPGVRESNFVPTSLKFELIPALDSTFSFTDGNPGSSSASKGYFPIAWVAAAGEVGDDVVILPARGWGDPLPRTVWPERFNYSWAQLG